MIRGWTCCRSKSTGNIYYFHEPSGRSVYEPPTNELSTEEIDLLCQNLLKSSQRQSIQNKSTTTSISQSACISKTTSQSLEHKPNQTPKKPLPESLTIPEERRIQTDHQKVVEATDLLRVMIAARCHEVMHGKAGHGSDISSSAKDGIRYTLDPKSVSAAVARANGTAEIAIQDRTILEDPLRVCGRGSSMTVNVGYATTVASMWCGRWQGKKLFPRDPFILRLPPVDRLWMYHIEDTAEELEVGCLAVGVGDDRHVLLFHPEHPPPEQREAEQEELEREAEVAASEAAMKAQLEKIALENRRRAKVRQTGNKITALDESEVVAVKPLFVPRDKRSFSEIQRDIRDKKRRAVEAMHTTTSTKANRTEQEPFMS